MTPPLLVAAALYFLPAILDHMKRETGAIFLLVPFFGWTVFLWIVSLVGAAALDPRPPRQAVSSETT